MTLSRLKANFGKVANANRPLTMERARGDENDVEMMSGTYFKGELAVRCSLEEPFSHFSSLQLETRWLLCCVSMIRMSKSQF